MDRKMHEQSDFCGILKRISILKISQIRKNSKKHFFGLQKNIKKPEDLVKIKGELYE